MKTHLVTGATGFVGLRLLGLLKNLECEVRLLSRSPLPGYELIFCDFQKDKIPLSALQSIDTVFHLAGFAHDLHVNSETEDLYQIVNVDATVQLAKKAVQAGVKRFVFVSSVKAGGHAFDIRCMTESEQNEPEGIYGKTKREAEIKLLEIGRQSEMHVSIIRSSLVYGPNMKGNLHMMLSGIEKGWFPPLPKLKNRRSMVHVDDLVRAIVLVAENNQANGEIFIVTDVSPHSSREIYEVMRKLLGKSIPKWSVPKFLFKFVALFNSSLKYKMNKLFEDDCYSSEKIQSIGFKAQRSLKEMNETSF